MEELIQQYHEDNGITYIMQAVNSDGDVIVKYESELSFDDVASYSAVADEYIEKYIIDELASKAEYEAEDLAERQLQEELDHVA